jgi:ABC-type antimicrobial peptide transport system permease subunit
LTLLGAFGIAALVLAAVGVYGVTQQAARMRTREIGIRMALGAEAQEVLRMMLRQSLVVVGLGLAAGVGAAMALTRLTTFVLFGVSPNDAATLVGMATLLGAVALVACWIPARRATRVDPTTSLRAE